MLKRFGSKVTDNFAHIYLTFLGIAVFLQQFLPSYLRYASIESISFKMNDGWCDPETEGIGTHCFGDFYYPLIFEKQANPWKGAENPYSPVSVLLYKPFNWINDSATPGSALILFLSALVISLIYPLLHLKFVSRDISSKTFGVLLVVSLSFAPAIVSIDRGNSQLFLIPFLYLFFRSWTSGDRKRQMIYGMVCILLKPQFLILSLVVFHSSGLKRTIKWLFTIAGVYLAAFLMYPSSFPINIIYWIYRLLTFPDYATRGVLMPVNISLGSDIDIILNTLNLEVSKNIVKTFVMALCVAFLYLLVKYFKTRSNMHNFILILFFPLLFTGTTFHYYLSILFIPFILHLSSRLDSESKGMIDHLRKDEIERPALSNSTFSISFLIFSIFSFVPWGIPWQVVYPGTKDLDWSGIGVNWIFSQYLLMIFSVVAIWPRRIPNSQRPQGKVTQ
jgi:hypothetical protein